MNAVPDMAMWQTWLLRLGVGALVIVVITYLLVRTFKSGVWQRSAWRGCFLAMAMFMVVEFGGLGLVWQGGAARESPVNVLPPDSDVMAGDGDEAAGAGDLHGVDASRQAGLGAVQAQATHPAFAPVWWPGWLWLAGALAWIARSLIAGSFLMIWRWRHCKVVAGGTLVERLRSVGQKLGFGRVPQILEAAGLAGPAVVGLWRPKLLLPAHFAEDFEPAKQEAMLAHELAHVAGRDSLWHLFADFVVAALWWQPLVWWARRRLRAASETAADEASCIVADGPALLAACLVELGRKIIHAPRTTWLAMAGDGFRSGLGRRVERLLALKPAAWQPVRRLRTFALITLLLLLLPAGAFFSTAWAYTQSFEGESIMSTKPIWKRSLAGIVLCTTFGFGAEAAMDPEQRQPQPAKGQPGPAPFVSVGPFGIPGPQGAEDAEFRLKVYRLKYRDPETIVSVASLLLHPHGWGRAAPGGEVGPGGFGEGPGDLAGLPGAGGPGGLSLLRLAADKRTRTLIARGRAQEIQIVTDLVAILDVEDGQAIPKIKNLRLFKLKHADPKAVLTVLSQLEIASFPSRIAADPQAKTIIVMAEAAVMREVAEVIQALDAEGEGRTKN